MCSTTSWFLPRSAVELGELLGDAGARARRGSPATRGDERRAPRPSPRRRRCRASPGTRLPRQRVLERGRRLRASSASSPLTFASSAFCAETGKTCSTGTPSVAALTRTWRSISASTSASRLQVVPQAVDLVEDHDAPRARRRVRAGDVVVPDLEVGPRDAGVGGEDEQHRVRRREQDQRQLGLGADRVEARRVEDDQPLLQQRMREVDDRVAPARDVDAALVAVLERRARGPRRAARSGARARSARA